MTRTPASTTRIHESLDAALTRKRVVLWYDPNGEWVSEFNDYQPASAEKRRVEGNEFSVKVAISRAPLDQRFLLYLPSAKPSELDNWLLDLLLAGHEFKADRASLDIQDAGLTLEFKQLAQQHQSFFRSSDLTTRLKELLRPNDDETAVRLKMLAVLAKQPPDIDQLLLYAFRESLGKTGMGELLHLAQLPQDFYRHQLTDHFWKAVASKFGYQSPEPNLSDFAVALFNSASSVRSTSDLQPLQPHARVFLSIWKDSLKNRKAFEQWSDHLAGVLRVEDHLLDPPTDFDPGDDDSYELIERFSIRRLLERFEGEASDQELLGLIRSRAASCWFENHQHGYNAIEQAITFRSLLAKEDLQVPSFEEGLQRYCNGWWRLDQAYRRCIFHAHAYQQPGLLKPLREWLENQYVNNVLLPLTNRWSDQVSQRTTWSSNELPGQQEFHMHYLGTPLRSKRIKRMFVVISDALRYEAARDFADRLNSQAGKGWHAEVDAMLGVLPSYTQLGMAALLPGDRLSINPAAGTALVDGQSATGTDNRDKILKTHAREGRAKAIQAEEFLNLTTSTEGAELIKEHDLIVIYHNRIDRIGDKREGEAETCQAVEAAFNELSAILRKINSLRGSRAVITADHGFLFQQEPVEANDRSAFPDAEVLSLCKRRFALGTGIKASPGQKMFKASELGLDDDWEAVFPLGLDRYPRSGSRFVHGGTSLQEVVVPVIKLKKERKDESRAVEAELLRMPGKVTTGRLVFGLFQLEPVEQRRRLPLQLRISLHAKADGVLLCTPRMVLLDSEASEAREREQQITLELSNAAGDYNNQLLELRVEKLLEGVSTPLPYKTKDVKLLRPFGSDFDDF